uniref:Uncharacterized protein n=1 Tax=Geospiza parvula TaxID=87175 RepID=A0A8C3MQR5_GEOPR
LVTWSPPKSPDEPPKSLDCTPKFTLSSPRYPPNSPGYPQKSPCYPLKSPDFWLVSPEKTAINTGSRCFPTVPHPFSFNKQPQSPELPRGGNCWSGDGTMPGTAVPPNHLEMPPNPLEVPPNPLEMPPNPLEIPLCVSRGFQAEEKQLRANLRSFR